jgi:uncharacterized iron-regulated membrane protein
MRPWQRWLHQPQRLWLRRALFQIHLWSGLSLGLYIVGLSLTGSALVYRRELVALVRTPLPAVDPARTTLSADTLRAAAARLYPDHQIADVSEAIARGTAAAHVTIERAGEKRERVFDPYTGEDLGDAFTWGERAILWTVRLHDDLLFQSDGRYVNGLLSALVTLLCLTGAVVWWPGLTRWRRSLTVSPGAGWRRLTWDLHSAMGAWFFLFILMWGVSGFYMGVPEPFTALADLLAPPDPDLVEERWVDTALAWLTRLHFGRWRTGWLKALWAVIGVVPAVMFVTGAIMWWNRVVRKRAVQGGAGAALAERSA